MIPRVFFFSFGSGKGEYRAREWMNVVEMEKNDLGTAMDVVEYGDCEVRGKRGRRGRERVKGEC